ncbi:MAG: helix-turn-helix transcriptional regulator [Myxococcota bacterium]
MNATVTLFTDRADFAPVWQPLLERNGFATRVCSPDDISVAATGEACVVDAGAGAYGVDAETDGVDELLTAVGFLRALGATPYVHVEDVIVEDVVEEICGGRITRSREDVARAAATLARRLDRERCRRFEFVTVSPRSGEVLAILGNGHSVLLRRPVHKVDDGSVVVDIALNADASVAVLELETGVQLSLQASSLAPQETPPPGGGTPIDGVRLGARLRELRLEAGLTQAELARRTGIHRPNIARVEAGRHTPSLETLSRLASAIGVPTTRVLSEG